jgi:hypothetical protein
MISIIERLDLFTAAIKNSCNIRVRRLAARLQDEVTDLALEVAPPRRLFVFKLPEPPFCTHCPPHFFWRPAAAKQERERILGCLVRETPAEISERVARSHALLAYAKKHILLKGTLRQEGEGMLYLDVPDALIDALLPFLEEGAERPPYFGFEGPFGAHFAVVRPQEFFARRGLGKIWELGAEFSFELTGCASVEPAAWPEMERVWYLTVKCPQLEELREKLLLPSTICGRDFLIPIAVRKRAQGRLHTQDLYRINVSCCAA